MDGAIRQYRGKIEPPTKVLDVTEDQPLNIQLGFVDLSRKDYGELRQNQYAHHKRRFSKHSSSIPSGEGFDERGTRRIAVRT
jgi:hypothetical protein